MKYCSSCVFTLKVVLMVKCSKYVICVLNWKLCRIRIIRRFSCSCLDYISELFFVFFRKPICCALCRSRFQIIQITCLFLILFENLSHHFHDFVCKLFSSTRRNVFYVICEVAYRFVHAVDSDSRKVISK